MTGKCLYKSSFLLYSTESDNMCRSNKTCNKLNSVWPCVCPSVYPCRSVVLQIALDYRIITISCSTSKNHREINWTFSLQKNVKINSGVYIRESTEFLVTF